MLRQKGFTLIELLVVVAVVAIATVAVALSIPSPARKQLEQEALRMSTLMEIARAQSRASGLPVRLHIQEHGFRFEGSQAVQKLSGHWLHETTHAPEQLLQLGPEPVIAPQQLRLASNQGLELMLATDGVGPFVEQHP